MNFKDKKKAPAEGKGVLNKTLKYASISAIAAGSAIGTAQAVDLTANDVWGDANSLTNGNTITNPVADLDIELKGFEIDLSDVEGRAKNIGAITDDGTNGAGDIRVRATTTDDYTVIAESAIITGDLSITQSATNKAAATLTINHAVANVVGGNLSITNIDTDADHDLLLDINLGTLTVSGTTTVVAAAGSSAAHSALTVDLAATFTGGVTLNDDTGLATFNANENNDVDITGTFNGATAGEGTIIVAGNTKDFKSAIGATNSLLEVQVDGATAVFDSTVAATTVDVNGTSTFTGAVTATTITIDAATTMTGGATATTITMGAEDVLTSAGDITAAIVVSDATSGLTLTGSDVTITGDINASSTTDAGIITASGDKTTFAKNIGAASGTNLDTLTVAASKRIVLQETANFVDQFTLAANAEMELAKTITGGTVFTMTGTTFAAADVPSTAKIYLPVNLVGGETLTLAAGHSDTDGTATAIDAVLVDTAVVNYSAAQDSGTTTVTATTKTNPTIATELGVTANDATAIVQALAAAVNDATPDSGAEDAVYNVMTANGGFSATADTAFTKQVVPQTDLISGSSSATQAVTGSLQGIMSNRMASLRSGDAYYGTGVAAGGMSAQSGFIQVFGSTTDQDSTKVGSGTKAGYDADTQGVAIGFDAVSDAGMTVGVSLSTANTDVDGKGTGKAKNSIDTYSASLYMDTATDNGYVEGSLTFGINENSTSRKVNTGGLNRTYTGSYDSQSIALNLAAGMPNEVGAGYLTPFGSISLTSMDIDAYTEKSTVTDDALRLKVAQDDVNSMVGTVGVKFHGEMSNGGVPMISLAINNEFGDSTIESTNTFQGGGTAFKTSTAVEELSATLGLGYSYGTDATSIEIAYEADANDDDYLSHYGSIKIVGKF